MARQRNKIAALPLELRQIVIRGLVDGKTYDAIRADLQAAGCPDRDLPYNSSFQAYMRGEEYRRVRDELLSWRRKAEEKRMLWRALAAGGGADALADVAVFEALEALLDRVRSGEAGAAEIAKLAGAIGSLKRTLIAEAQAKARAEAQKAVEKVEETALDDDLSPEEKRRRIREHLGLV